MAYAIVRYPARGQAPEIYAMRLNEETIESIMEGGRCRWHIENQTFNTLENKDCNLEDNYAHGEKHLTTNLSYITTLAFLVDQIQ